MLLRPAAAQEPVPGTVQDELLAAREAVWRAWFAHDTIALARLLPEAAAAGSGDSWEDRQAILAGSRAFAARGGRLVRLEFAGTDIRVLGDVAVVTSTYTYETEITGKRAASTGRATEVFVKRRGTWINPFWHMDGG
jgi:hypothetical protein